MKSPLLRTGRIAAGVAVATVVTAVAVGAVYGIALSILLLATGALALVIALLWASVRNLTGDTPLTLDEALGLGAPSPEEEQKRAVLRALKDLEYERSVGKISEEDYREYSARYREEARRLMERVDASLAEARALAEKLLAERVAAAELATSAPGTKASGAAPAPRSKPSDDAPESLKRDDDDDDDDDAAESLKRDAAESLKRDSKGTKQPPPSTSTEPQKQARSATKELASPCVGCGGDNDADAKFCKHCGATLDGARTAQPVSAHEEKAQ
jgi:hypothetical protein